MTLPYKFWKEALRVDAARQNKLDIVDFLSDLSLNLFYERGCKPSVESILQDAEAA